MPRGLAHGLACLVCAPKPGAATIREQGRPICPSLGELRSDARGPVEPRACAHRRPGGATCLQVPPRGAVHLLHPRRRERQAVVIAGLRGDARIESVPQLARSGTLPGAHRVGDDMCSIGGLRLGLLSAGAVGGLSTSTEKLILTESRPTGECKIGHSSAWNQACIVSRKVLKTLY